MNKHKWLDAMYDVGVRMGPGIAYLVFGITNFYFVDVGYGWFPILYLIPAMLGMIMGAYLLTREMIKIHKEEKDD